MSTYNNQTLAPVNPFPERVTSIVEYEVGLNTRREGGRYAEEQLVQRGNLAGAFGNAAFTREGEQVYGYTVATGRSPIAADISDPSMSRGPTWDVLDDEIKLGFLQGEASAPGHSYPHPWQPRAGANTRPLAPTFGFNQGERPTAVYEVTVPPVNGGRARRNVADVSDR